MLSLVVLLEPVSWEQLNNDSASVTPPVVQQRNDNRILSPFALVYFLLHANQMCWVTLLHVEDKT